MKFKDADLIGIPLRITVGGRGIKEGDRRNEVARQPRKPSSCPSMNRKPGLRRPSGRRPEQRLPRTETPCLSHAPTPARKHASATELQLEDAWRVVVLNDPVNLMSYVVMVFKKVLGFDETKARKHMLEVHEQGRSVVWIGRPRDRRGPRLHPAAVAPDRRPRAR